MSSNPPINPGNNRNLAQLWVFCLVLSLLLAQTLGQLHAVKHVIQRVGVTAVAPGVGAHGGHKAHDAHAGKNGESFLDELFSSHSSTADCRLYDHLSDGQAMPLLFATALPIVLPSRLVAIFAGDALARWAALFDARGPPLTV